YHITLRDRYSHVESRDLPWLSRFLWTYIGVAVAAIGLHVLNIFLQIDHLVMNAILSLIFCGCLFALAYARWHVAPITPEPAADPTPAGESQGSSVRRLHTLPDELYRDLVTRLEKTLETDKAYLDNDLDRMQLSERMGASPHHVSEVINRHYRSNFFDVVNRLRVEEVKRKLKDPKHALYSILGIAMESGFNTKSSFNTAFRKHAGTTPSEFRDAA
ncbi:MAG TPA: helix-turn-helix domain-containing protein, partial [Flavobacteriales bacterium]